jgi:choice-of-anchor B domain-containing protein
VADSTEAGGRLGAAVALAGDEALIGAPGRDRVVRLVRDADGSWAGAGELRPATGSTGGPQGLGFGAALALDGARLVVGAPGAEGGRGAVHRRIRRNGAWEAEEPVASPVGEPGDGFGAAVALAEGRAVVGAPGADGGRGRAAVFDPAAAAPEVAWLDPELGLERVAGGEVRCREGEAAGFACEGVDLLSFLPLSAMGAGPAEQVSDTWGWNDPETGREYALVGRTAGLAFVDVTDPASPRFVGLMPANPSGARDIKVYRDHAFLTGDGAGEHGLLVFDLTRLRDAGARGAGASGAAGTAEARAGGGLLFEPDARYDRVASAHNLVIDTESGFAYTVGTNTGGESCGGGLHMIDIRDPLSPTFAGCYTDTEGLIWSGRTHDAQCTVYRGPDEAYRGRQLCFAANETALRIVDVTDKSAPEPIARASHPGTAYVHQGWLTEDHRYFLVNDELDEIVGTTDRTRTLVWDVAELDDPILVAEHLGPDQATDHNLYIRGDRAYLANYQAGVRVLDISDPENPVEVGWFDTTPYEGNPPGFLGGAWTAYPFLESGTVVVTSMNEGLFLLRPRPAVLP